MTRISDLIARERTLSFEFSAPRDAEAERRLGRTLTRLAAIKPSFMSVTYGPSGTTRGPTEDVVRYIQHDLGVTAMPHLTCVAHTCDEITGILDRYRESNIVNLLALLGDLPPNASEIPSGHFTRATELVEFARNHGSFAIGVAAHPEGHPKASSREADRKHQAAKLAEADFAVTQFFFRVEYYERYIEELAALGTTTPVIPGIMPPTNAEHVARMSALNNTEFPAEIRERLVAAGDDMAARRAIGVEVATDLGRRLLDAGAPGLHLYTMNFSAAALAVVRNLGLREVA